MRIVSNSLPFKLHKDLVMSQMVTWAEVCAAQSVGDVCCSCISSHKTIKSTPKICRAMTFKCQGGQWWRCGTCVTSPSSTSSSSKIWWFRESSTQSTYRSYGVSGNFCHLVKFFGLKLNHLFVSRCWVGFLWLNESRKRCRLCNM